MGRRKTLYSAVLAMVLTGCDGPEAQYDAGYQDGYSAGYATECGPRAVLIDGDFRGESYRHGLAAGYADGAKACREAPASHPD